MVASLAPLAWGEMVKILGISGRAYQAPAPVRYEPGSGTAHRPGLGTERASGLIAKSGWSAREIPRIIASPGSQRTPSGQHGHVALVTLKYCLRSLGREREVTEMVASTPAFLAGEGAKILGISPERAQRQRAPAFLSFADGPLNSVEVAGSSVFAYSSRRGKTSIVTIEVQMEGQESCEFLAPRWAPATANGKRKEFHENYARGDDSRNSRRHLWGGALLNPIRLQRRG